MANVLCRLVASAGILAIACLSSCAGPRWNAAGQQSSALGLPALSRLDKRASGNSDSNQNGIDAFLHSSGAVDVGQGLSLASAVKTSEWGIWRFSVPASMTPQSIDLDLDDAGTDEAWVGIAHWDSSSWKLSGPFGAPQSADLTAGNCVSPGGYLYVAVVCTGVHTAWVKSLTLHSSGNLPPAASFTATPQYGNPGASVQLDASGSTDDGTIVKYEWDLDGDGSFETDGGSQPTQSTTLPNPEGSVQVGLKVTDDGALTDTYFLTLIGTTSQFPTALFTATPQVGTPGQAVDLDASTSFDPDGSIAKYEWDLDGNGSYELDNGNDPTISTTLPDPAGSAVVGLRVTDSVGLPDTYALTLTSTVDTDPVPPIDLTPAGSEQSEIVLKVVNGYPAISYVDYSHNVKFLRARTANGSEWNAPIIVRAYDNVSQPTWLCMDVANGKPALAYAGLDSDSKGAIYYLQAADSTGSGWGDPQQVAGGLDTTTSCDLIIVAGKPALAYLAGPYNEPKVMFVRAEDADGAAWGTAQIVCAPFIVSPGISLAVINDRPAVSFNGLIDFSHWSVNFLQASNSEGTSWGSPAAYFPLANAPAWERTWLCVLSDGPFESPALLSQPGTNPGELTFLGALDPITLADTAGSNLVPGYYTMSMVAGVPAVAYRSSNNFYYREATEIDGSAWGSAQLLADLGGNAPPYPSVTDVLGAPAVAWRGGANQGSKIWFSKLR